MVILVGWVVSCYVINFVVEYAGELCFVVEMGYNVVGEVYIVFGKCKGVDNWRIE